MSGAEILIQNLKNCSLNPCQALQITLWQPLIQTARKWGFNSWYRQTVSHQCNQNLASSPTTQQLYGPNEPPVQRHNSSMGPMSLLSDTTALWAQWASCPMVPHLCPQNKPSMVLRWPLTSSEYQILNRNAVPPPP
jgi:hypothetical protein